MKRIVSFLMILALTLCTLASCVPGPESESSKPESTSEAESESTSEPSSEPASEPEESSVVTEYYDEYGRFVELDEQGNIKTVTGYNDDGSVAVVDDYENGVLVTTTWYDGERVSTVMEFAPNGNPIHRTKYAVDGKVHSIDEYNDRGVISKETIFYDNGTDWILYEFKDGRPAKETTYRPNGYIDNVLEYDQNGFPAKYIQYIDGVVDSYEEYVNGKNGLALRTNRYDPDGTLTAYTENQYDESGNCVLEATYTPEGRLVHVFTLLCDANGQIVEQANYSFGEDGSYGYGSRNHLDANGNWTKEDIAERDVYELYDSIVGSHGN